MPALRRLYEDYFARTGVAAIVFPTTMAPAPLIGEDDTVEIRGRRSVFLQDRQPQHIAPGSTAGLPGLVPACLAIVATHGLPVGDRIPATGGPGSDQALMALGLTWSEPSGAIPAPRI